MCLLIGASTLPVSADTTAFVRIVHASPDIGTADVFLDGNKILSNFEFGTVTGYVPIPAGPHKVVVGLIGTGPNAGILTQNIAVQPGVVYTVAALGTKASGFALQIFIDNNVVTGGMAKLRVYHLSPDSGTVNVASSSSTIVAGLAYKQASDYVTIPPGSYTFNVTTSTANTPAPVTASLKALTVTSIFVVGLANGTPKLEFVDAQVPATPGLPGTGSDPTPLPAAGNAFNLFPWIWGLLAVLLMFTSLLGLRWLHRHTSLISLRRK